jgi:hypothetical protein
MNKSRRQWCFASAATALLLNACVSLSNQDRGSSDLRPEPLIGVPAPTFASYRTPIDATVVDPMFRTKEAIYLANEMHNSAFPFFESLVSNGMVTSDPDLLYMTTVESYWYSRYNMSALVTESRLGLHLVYGPYLTDWALREGRGNVNRDRADYVRSNKGVLLQEIIPWYMARTGFPRRFEDASPTMLQFASGDPRYVRPLDKGVRFESTENLLRERDLRRIYGDDLEPQPTGMGVGGNDMWTTRVNYRENFLSLRWGHGDMEHVIDLGAEGQTLMKQALWMEYFFQQNHHDGRYLGNDPEEGFRGAMLNLMAVNKMLMLKGAMLYDGNQLTGVDPRVAEPGAYYFPHRIAVRMRMIGDLPPRPEEFSVQDASSQLFDQASLLWGLSEYYHFADPTNESNWNTVFGQPPFDGSVMEQKYIILAEGLSSLVLRNIAAMHRQDDGLLVSEWLPEDGAGTTVSTRDIGMVMTALANFARHVQTNADDVNVSRQLLRQQAEFLVSSLQAPDGSISDGYDFARRVPIDQGRTLLAQSFAIRGLMEAYKELEDDRYLEAAESVYAFMNDRLWDESTGVYRSQVDATETEYTPVVIGATLGAMRELILATENPAELERYKRFWVQGVNSSGIQQSEYEETGEKDFFAEDGDGDGIPRMEYAGGHGVAPVFASRVVIQTPLTGVARR